jgi:hypothetical protein
MTSVQINTLEIINQINENNDSKQNLGDGDKTFHRQGKNGIDLLCCSEFSNSLSFDTQSIDKLNTTKHVVDEMTEYENAKNEYNNEAFLKKYRELTEQIKEEVQSRSNSLELSSEKKENFTNVPEINYEDMYKDDICTFFIGSVTLIGLYIVYKMIDN